MEAPLEDQTPAGALAENEGPDHEEVLKGSVEAITFMSSIGEYSVYFPGFSEVLTRELRISTTWLWHILPLSDLVRGLLI